MPTDERGFYTPNYPPSGYVPDHPYQSSGGDDDGSSFSILGVIIAGAGNLGMWWWASYDFVGWQVVVSTCGVLVGLIVLALAAYLVNR